MGVAMAETSPCISHTPQETSCLILESFRQPEAAGLRPGLRGLRPSLHPQTSHFRRLPGPFRPFRPLGPSDSFSPARPTPSRQLFQQDPHSRPSPRACQPPAGSRGGGVDSAPGCGPAPPEPRLPLGSASLPKPRRRGFSSERRSPPRRGEAEPVGRKLGPALGEE